MDQIGEINCTNGSNNNVIAYIESQNAVSQSSKTKNRGFLIIPLIFTMILTYLQYHRRDKKSLKCLNHILRDKKLRKHFLIYIQLNQFILQNIGVKIQYLWKYRRNCYFRSFIL